MGGVNVHRHGHAGVPQAFGHKGLTLVLLKHDAGMEVSEATIDDYWRPSRSVLPGQHYLPLRGSSSADTRFSKSGESNGLVM